jgi:hypothetical protein
LLKNISQKAYKYANFSFIENIEVVGDNCIKLRLNKKYSDRTKGVEELNKIKEYDSLKMFCEDGTTFSIENKVYFSYYLQEIDILELSFEDFEDYCQTKFNPLFANRMRTLINILNKEEMLKTLIELKNKYEITFNTIWNVLKEYTAVKGDQPLPLEFEENILHILEIFETEIMEANKKNENLKKEIEKSFEKSLNERLKVEVQLLERKKQNRTEKNKT